MTIAVLQSAIEQHQRGLFFLARECYQTILRENPDNAEVQHLIGLTLYQEGSYSEAIYEIKNAIKLDPLKPHFHSNLGNALQCIGLFNEGIQSYKRAISLKPSFAEAHFNLGNACTSLGLYDEALQAYDHAIASKSDYVDALVHRGIAYRLRGNLLESIRDLRRALSLAPLNVAAHVNLGNTLKDMGSLSEALAQYDRALMIDADHVEANFNRGATLYESRRPQEALASYDRALNVRPDYPNALTAKAVALLQQGEFKAGWPLYESRWRASTGPRRKKTLKTPLWLGDADLRGRTIFLYAEQGLGDTFQFCRYVPLVKCLGARVVVEVQKPLVEIISTLTGVDEIITSDSVIPRHDYHCPLLSLPLAFRTETHSIPSATPYLRAKLSDVRRWRAHIGNAGFKIAVSWQGNSNNPLDINRRYPLTRLDEISALEGVRLISIQKHGGIEQLDQLPSGFKIEVLPECFDGPGRSFLDTAAVMKSVDLVITSDTAVAHLAGALGVPTWVALPYAADWRWGIEGEKSGWYPNHRLFRPSTSTDLTGTFRDMRNQLATILAQW